VNAGTPFDDEPEQLMASLQKVLDEQADAIRERLVTIRVASLVGEHDGEAVARFRGQMETYDRGMLAEMLAYVLWYGCEPVEHIARLRLIRFNNATNRGGDPLAAVLEEDARGKGPSR